VHVIHPWLYFGTFWLSVTKYLPHHLPSDSSQRLSKAGGAHSHRLSSQPIFSIWDQYACSHSCVLEQPPLGKATQWTKRSIYVLSFRLLLYNIYEVVITTCIFIGRHWRYSLLPYKGCVCIIVHVVASSLPAFIQHYTILYSQSGIDIHSYHRSWVYVIVDCFILGLRNGYYSGTGLLWSLHTQWPALSHLPIEVLQMTS